MSTHTPGPWAITSQYSPEMGRIAPTPYIVDAVGQNVAAALLNVPKDEHEANARLIAAAPELLAALIEAERNLSILALALRNGVVRGLPASWPADLQNVLDLDIRDAIRKATGHATATTP